MNLFFNSILNQIRVRKGLFIVLIISTIVVIVLGVISAINLDGGVLPIDLSNIAFIKYLKGDCGVFFLIFGTILNLLLFYSLILLFCCKRFLIPFAIIFYLYFVYSQIVIFTSLILLYGFFNTLILILLLLIYILLEIVLLMLFLLFLLNYTDSFGYFKNCFSSNNSNLIILTLALIVISILFCVVLIVLKSFVILLIY